MNRKVCPVVTACSLLGWSRPQPQPHQGWTSSVAPARREAAQEVVRGEVRGRREGSTNLQGCGEAGGGHSVVRHKTGGVR